MAWCALLHKLGEDAVLESLLPFGAHGLHDALAVIFPCPVGGDDIPKVLSGLLVDLKRYGLTGIEDIEILLRMNANLRIGWCCLWLWTALAND